MTLAALPNVLPPGRRAEWRELHAFQEERWERVGRQLAASWPPDMTVALAPVGVIGYHSRLTIVDLLGITHAAFLDIAPDTSIPMKGHQRYDADWVLAQEPDAILLGNAVIPRDSNTLVVSAWERTLFEHEDFRSGYRLMVMPVEESYPLYYFLARGVPPPRGSQEASLAR